MKKALAVLCSLSLSVLASGCVSDGPVARPSREAAVVRCDGSVPAFSCDGRVRRDLDTGAPLFVAAAESLASRAPRFTAEGAIARDLETGAPMYDVIASGEVVRVLVSMP